MNLMEKNLHKYLKEDEINRIQSFTIGIAGCGGIGSNTAVNLVRLGFKNFILLDFDTIEYSNLNRQFYFYDQIGSKKCETLKLNLLKINPELNIKTIFKKANKENIHTLFSQCDLLVEGFDSIQDKMMLVDELYGSIPLIATSGLGDYWFVDDISSREVSSDFTIVGDQKSDTESGKSPLSPGVSITAGKVSAGVLKWCLGGCNV